MKTYKIKLEDKIALINRLNGDQVNVSSYNIKDNEPEGYFEITLSNDEDIKIMDTILDKSPKINTLREMIRKIVREELSR